MPDLRALGDVCWLLPSCDGLARCSSSQSGTPSVTGTFLSMKPFLEQGFIWKMRGITLCLLFLCLIPTEALPPRSQILF
jgi:hypothetical protein